MALAAEVLDTKVQSFLMSDGIGDINHYVNGMQDIRERKSVYERLHLAIRHGGLGITSSMLTMKGAYIGSLALCSKWICNIIPDLKERAAGVVCSPTYAAFNDCLDELSCERLKGWISTVSSLNNIIRCKRVYLWEDRNY